MIKNIFYLLILSIIIVQCSPKVVKQTSVEEYSEDLSSVKPPIDSIKIKETDEIAKVPYTAPMYDQTQELNSLVDSLAKDNLRKKYTYYTIQVYVGKSREEANEVRSKVYKIIPAETPKLEWSQPNFRVKVGKFESRLDAYKTFTLLKNSFPGALLVSEKLYLSN